MCDVPHGMQICVVGAPHTGKTLFSMMMAGQNPYSESYEATMGVRVQVRSALRPFCTPRNVRIKALWTFVDERVPDSSCERAS